MPWSIARTSELLHSTHVPSHVMYHDPRSQGYLTITHTFSYGFQIE